MFVFSQWRAVRKYGEIIDKNMVMKQTGIGTKYILPSVILFR